MKYVVSCKSRISGCYSTCKDGNGDILVFDNEQKAREYARGMCDLMGINYHYWVEEYEPLEGCGIGGELQRKENAAFWNVEMIGGLINDEKRVY